MDTEGGQEQADSCGFPAELKDQSCRPHACTNRHRHRGNVSNADRGQGGFAAW